MASRFFPPSPTKAPRLQLEDGRRDMTEEKGATRRHPRFANDDLLTCAAADLISLSPSAEVPNLHGPPAALSSSPPDGCGAAVSEFFT
jgi:hypothetical protein